MAEVEPEVVETVETIEAIEPEPEPEPEKKKRKKRDDAPVRAPTPRVRRVTPKPSVVREELPPAPTEVDANFFVQLGHNLRSLEKESRQRRLSALEIV